MIIKENFLDKEFFKEIQDHMMGRFFPWYSHNHMVEDDFLFFSHDFFNKGLVQSSVYEKFIVPIIKKLDVKALINVRSNFNVRQNKIYTSNWHSDLTFKAKTAIYYINTCNGKTEFKDNIVECEENKMIVFDSDEQHRMSSQTDSLKRIVINFNYF